MAEGKKFYWLKLKRDFFKRHDIRIIEEMPNGKDYVLFYLKLLLESIDHEGSLRFSDTIPYNEQMLAVITNTNVDIVRNAMQLFIELHLIEIFDDQTIYMGEVEKMIGSESESAGRMRKLREKQQASLCDGDVRKCDTEKEREIQKEINKDIYLYHSSEEAFGKSDFSTGFSTGLSTELSTDGVICISQEEKMDLLSMLSIEDYNHYLRVIADCVLKGKPYKKKTHYQAILDMAKADRKIK